MQDSGTPLAAYRIAMDSLRSGRTVTETEFIAHLTEVARRCAETRNNMALGLLTSRLLNEWNAHNAPAKTPDAVVGYAILYTDVRTNCHAYCRVGTKAEAAAFIRNLIYPDTAIVLPIVDVDIKEI